MLAFIAGGAASGKSAWAESLAMALGGRKCYIATMEPFGEEAEIRIQHHRNARREERVSNGRNLYRNGAQRRYALL